ncbi:LOW QUALITY PROTEIN: hypothetical protein U9M48_044092 [Paspalum notatum var. saurae]|uniref:Uncharacterized protein n=1 Tax=Paspalum notatum var. saurae TaxID=547442 RepID=A0AAQ3UW09_PASNO
MRLCTEALHLLRLLACTSSSGVHHLSMSPLSKNGANGPLNTGEALRKLPASLNKTLCPYGSGRSGSSGTSMSPSSILTASPMVGRSATITCAHRIPTRTNLSMAPPPRGLSAVDSASSSTSLAFPALTSVHAQSVMSTGPVGAVMSSTRRPLIISSSSTPKLYTSLFSLPVQRVLRRQVAVRPGDARREVRLPVAAPPGEAEVRHARAHLAVEQDVRRLDVPVVDRRLDAVMQVLEAFGDVHDDGPPLRPSQRGPLIGRRRFPVPEDEIIERAVGHEVVHQEHLLPFLDVVVGDAAAAERHQIPVPEVADDLHLVGELLVPALHVRVEHLLDGDHGPVREHAAVDGPEPAAADEVALGEAACSLGELGNVEENRPGVGARVRPPLRRPIALPADLVALPLLAIGMPSLPPKKEPEEERREEDEGDWDGGGVDDRAVGLGRRGGRRREAKAKSAGGGGRVGGARGVGDAGGVEDGEVEAGARLAIVGGGGGEVRGGGNAGVVVGEARSGPQEELRARTESFPTAAAKSAAVDTPAQ